MIMISITVLGISLFNIGAIASGGQDGTISDRSKKDGGRERGLWLICTTKLA